MATRSMILIVMFVGFSNLLGETVDYSELLRVVLYLLALDIVLAAVLNKRRTSKGSEER